MNKFINIVMACTWVAVIMMGARVQMLDYRLEKYESYKMVDIIRYNYANEMTDCETRFFKDWTNDKNK